MFTKLQGSAAAHSPPSRPGCVVADAARAGRCCRTADRASDGGPWTQRSEVVGQMLTQLSTSCPCPGCLTCFPFSGTLLETEGLQWKGRDVTLLKGTKLLNFYGGNTEALIPLRKFLWVSKIWTTSLNQARFISGDDACMMKRVTLPSVPREVRTRQHGSSSECSSTPRQLT